MKTPRRSAAIAKALTSETDGLPENFAARVAARAEASAATRSSRWNEVALAAAFVVMMGLCVAGWKYFGTSVESEWLTPLLSAATSQPWLVIGITCVAIVQGLTFRRRVAS